MKFINFTDFLKHMDSIPSIKEDISLVGLDDVHVELLFYYFFQKISMAVSEYCKIYWLIFPSEEMISKWEQYFREINCEVEEKNKSSVLRLPYISLSELERDSLHDLTSFVRSHCLVQLTDRSRIKIVCTTLLGLGMKTIGKNLLTQNSRLLKQGYEYDYDELVQYISELGYCQVDRIEEPGQFVLRGGIIDIYAPYFESPVRLRFVFDTLDSIRLFHLADQRSYLDCDLIIISPFNEVVIKKQERKKFSQKLFDFLNSQISSQREREEIIASFNKGEYFPEYFQLQPILREEQFSALNYADSADAIIFFGSKKEMLSEYSDYISNLEMDYKLRKEEQSVLIEPYLFYFLPSVLEAYISCNQNISITNQSVIGDAIFEFAPEVGHCQYVEIEQKLDEMSFSGWVKRISVLVDQGYLVVILIPSNDYFNRIEERFLEKHINVKTQYNILKNIILGFESEKGVILGKGFFSDYIKLENIKIILVPFFKILGGNEKKKKANNAIQIRKNISEFKQFELGSYVVHADHGISIFEGLSLLQLNGEKEHFIKLQFYGGDKLYLPIDKLGKIQIYLRYSDIDDENVPLLDSLKSSRWQKRKSKVLNSVKDIADKLIALSAERALVTRFLNVNDEDIYLGFESDFPFQETPDQLIAIQDVMSDLARSFPMDRLICGDVGLGKTEVALRASMKVVLNGMQVMILVPTTVLSFQHFRTFSARFSKFGVVVSQINRFKSTKSNKQVLNDFQSGRIDILIGTHRLLNNDVIPKKLGLLVVDEEQKFGVLHKEKIKSLSSGVDILTMTATPIPRTLHMSMLGFKDISTISTPPEERLPVSTFVINYDERIIEKVISTEIRRGGQVFFIHNKIIEIPKVVSILERILPRVKIRYAHGKMHDGELEEIFLAFIEQKFSVLVCTSIIESGIDISNVNTLIVNNAENFGLAQLHQIRGRVGRGERQAYVYFVVTERYERLFAARRRLGVLLKYQDLGSGFMISRIDLEMRGAGNFLGVEQSGNIDDVGAEYYTKLLEAEIRRRKSSAEDIARPDTEIKFSHEASIPDSYIRSDFEKVKLYRYMFTINSFEDLQNIRNSLIDIYGEFPYEVKCLFLLAELKYYLSCCFVQKVVYPVLGGGCELQFSVLSEKRIQLINEFVFPHKKLGKYHLTDDYKLILNVKEDNSSLSGNCVLSGEKLIDFLSKAIYPLFQKFTENSSHEKNN